MDLRQLEYVEAVARLRNFTRAAAELHVAQPALSLAIRKLEAELGVQLFERTSRRVTVTDAGDSFVRTATRVLRDAGALRQDMARYAAGSSGVVRVSAWYHVDPDLDLLRTFIRDVPSIEISIVELPADAALE